MIKKLKEYITTPLHLAVGLCFLIISILFALWITRIPEVKSFHQLSEGDLGTALFFIPLGALISMSLSTKVIAKLGEGKSTIFALSSFSLVISLPLYAQTYWHLCGALFIAGVTMGWVDISMNAVANTIEKVKKVKIMSTSHGFWSLGGIVGGVIGGLTASFMIASTLQMAVASFIAITIIMLFISPQLKDIHDEQNKGARKQFALPNSSELWVLAILVFCILLAEGAIVDWSTVFLKETLGSTAAIAGIGYALFSATMTIGRFNGDYLTERLGAKKLMTIGLSVATIGFTLLLLHNITLALIGFAIVGFGYSSVIPILFAEAAKQHKESPALGLASVATIGYTGFLIGPVIIGWVSEWQNLTFSFGLLLIITTTALIVYRSS